MAWKKAQDYREMYGNEEFDRDDYPPTQQELEETYAGCEGYNEPPECESCPTIQQNYCRGRAQGVIKPSFTQKETKKGEP